MDQQRRWPLLRNLDKTPGLSQWTHRGADDPGIALLEGAADAETVWKAAQIDEDWQTEMWGEDDLATRTRDAHHADFMAGARFLSLL